MEHQSRQQVFIVKRSQIHRKVQTPFEKSVHDAKSDVRLIIRLEIHTRDLWLFY